MNDTTPNPAYYITHVENRWDASRPVSRPWFVMTTDGNKSIAQCVTRELANGLRIALENGGIEAPEFPEKKLDPSPGVVELSGYDEAPARAQRDWETLDTLSSRIKILGWIHSVAIALIAAGLIVHAFTS